MVALGSFEFDVSLDIAKSTAGLDQLKRSATELQAILGKGSAQGVTLNTSQATQAVSGLKAGIAQAAAEVQKFAGLRPTIALKLDARDSNVAVDRLLKSLQSVEDHSKVSIRVTGSSIEQAVAASQRLEQELTALAERDVKVNVSVTQASRGSLGSEQRLGLELLKSEAAAAKEAERATAAAAKEAERATAAAAKEIERLRREAEKKIVPRIDTRESEDALGRLRQASLAVFRGLVQGSGAGSGFLIGAGAGVGAIAALGVATAVSQVTQAMIGGTKASLAYNAQIETASATLENFTGSAGQAQKALGILRQYADFTPFNTDEVIAGGRAFIIATNGDIAQMEKLVHLAGQLAATNPSRENGGGFEGAVTALQNVLGGQTESIADRFNIPRPTIQALKDAGLSGIELAAALVKAAHGSEELVQKLSGTFEGQLSNFNSALANLGQIASKPIFEELKTGLVALNATLAENGTSWADLANKVGQAAAFIVRSMERVVQNSIIGKLAAAAQSIGQIAAGLSQFQGLSELGERVGPDPRAAALRAQRDEQLAALHPLLHGTAAQPAADVQDKAAEAAKQAQKLATDTIAARHTILTSQLHDLAEESSAEKASQSDKIKAINEVRDAAISAADKRRDAAIAGLDAEQTALSRARTLQDRSISASNEAILAGLERQHTAQLKGLDEEITKIEKRGELALKELDQEIQGVERKRDAAIRALDDEAREESRRHAEALRNIDAERDRKLGVLDKQLAALDAAAQRDQRAQTDQSLARALADDKRALKQATTPEERARAKRSIGDDQAAVQREAVNRQREDQRAAIRVQQDAIRAAADAAKQAEGTKNTGITDNLAGQKQAATDQAKLDTDRLNAIKDRVKTETDIEAQSIRDRIKLENDAYQQAVKDQQEAFKQQADALADQRYNEDQAIAGRRAGIQAAYAKDAEDAKTSADAQVKAQEELTRLTLAELEKRKQAAEKAAQGPPLKLISPPAVGETPRSRSDLPPAVPSDQADRRGASAGTPQPTLAPVVNPDVDQALASLGPKVGAALSAAFHTIPSAPDIDAWINGISAAMAEKASEASKAIASLMAGGFSAGLATDEQTQKDVIKWVDDAIIKSAKDTLGIASPSKVFSQIGTDTAQGFIDGFGTVDIFAAGRKPFEDLETWINPGLANLMTNDGSAAAIGWQSGYQTQDLYAAGRLPFENLLQWTAGLPTQMQGAGAASAAAFGAGWTSRNPGAAIQGSLAAMITAAGQLNPSWTIVGQNFAIAVQNGITNYFNAHPIKLSFGSGTYRDEPSYPGRADGGTIPPGGWSWVGERGPELIQAGQQGASVLSAPDSQKFMQRHAAMMGAVDGAGDAPDRSPVPGFGDMEAILGGVHNAALQASLALVPPWTPYSRFAGLAEGPYAAANFLGGDPADVHPRIELPATDGLITAGNIDLNARPVVRNADGSISTVRSISIEEDGLEVLIPTVSPDGRILSNRQAIALYRQTDQFLGKFTTPDAATTYAELLHEAQARSYLPPPWLNDIVVNPRHILADVADELGGQATAADLAAVIAATGLGGVISHEVAHNAERGHDQAHALLTEAIRSKLGDGVGAGLEGPFLRFAEQYPVQVPGRYAGGPMDAGQPYWVGERGPELVMPRQAGSVLPADVSRNVMAVASGQGGSGGRTVNLGPVTIQINGANQSPEAIGREVMRQMVALMDVTERNAPDAVPSTQAGAA